MTPDDDEHEDGRRRASRTTPERLQMLESDTQNQARLIQEILKATSTFSNQQVGQIETVVRGVFSEVGLRLDDPDHIDAFREDQRFLRRFRIGWGSTANKIGNVVLVAAVGLVLTIGGAGFWAWLKSGGN